MKESFLEITHVAPSTAERTRIDAEGGGGRSVRSTEPLQLGAEHPDAAPGWIDTAVRVAVHAIVLIGVVAFLAYCCLWLPLSRWNTGEAKVARMAAAGGDGGVDRARAAAADAHAALPGLSTEEADRKAERSLPEQTTRLGSADGAGLGWNSGMLDEGTPSDVKR